MPSKRPIARCSQSVPPQVKQIPDDSVNRQKSLRLASGFEPSHLSLTLPCRLMRDFSPVVGVALGVVHDGRHEATVRYPIASELVADEAARLHTLALQQLAEEPSGSGGVSSTLDEDVEDISILVNGTPQVVSLASDADEDLVEEPGVPESTLPPPYLDRVPRSELRAPTPDRLVRNDDSALRQKVLHIAEAQTEAVV